MGCEDFGYAGDEFLIGDCIADHNVDGGGWDEFETRECFLDGVINQRDENASEEEGGGSIECCVECSTWVDEGELSSKGACWYCDQLRENRGALVNPGHFA